jgi:hypothetical protein
MLSNNNSDFKPGITSFDDYMAWHYTCGINEVCPDGIDYTGPGEVVHLSDYEKETIRENIVQNVTSLTDLYPDVDFYYFFTPYSFVWAMKRVTSGEIYKYIEAEKFIIELILEHDNISLFSFNNRTDIRTDLNNYRDDGHYAYWVNSLMLKWMYDGEYRITSQNYEKYLEDELDNYLTFNYNSLNGQEDYENDFFAAALLNKELTGAAPINFLSGDSISEIMQIQDIDDYRYLVFSGRKIGGDGIFECVVINDEGVDIASKYVDYSEVDDECHQYIIDISKLEGNVSIEFRHYTDWDATDGDTFDDEFGFEITEMMLY